MMRIAFNSLPESLVGQLNSLSAQQYRLQNQAATGQRISQLEDDPAAMRRVLNLQVSGSRLAQYRQNIATLQQRATGAYNAMNGLQTISQRAGEIATLADGTKSPDQLKLYATEVTQLIQQAAQLMNGKFQGDYLFGGTQTDQPPFVVATDTNGNVTGVAYQGNESVASAEIASGVTLSATVPGANTSGSGPAGLITDSRNGADFFNHLIALQNHLLAGDSSSIVSSDIPALSKDENNITLQIGHNGVIQSQLNAADSVAAAQATSVTEMVSQDADANLADTLTRLSATQTAYQAALQSGAALLNQNLSLLNYIQ
jgi:flagellar hook-associated protein 3 FlgL